MTNIRYFDHLCIPENAIFRILNTPDTPADIYTTDISEVIDICRSYKDYNMTFIQIDIISLDSDGLIPRTNRNLSMTEIREELVKHPKVRRVVLSGTGKEVYLETFILYTDPSDDYGYGDGSYREYYFDYSLLYGKSHKALDAAWNEETTVYSTITKNDYSPKDGSSLKGKELKITFNPLYRTTMMYNCGITNPYLFLEFPTVVYMLEAWIVNHKRYGWWEEDNTDIWFVPASTLRIKKTEKEG